MMQTVDIMKHCVFTVGYYIYPEIREINRQVGKQSGFIQF